MATFRFRVTGTKRESVPIYVRFSAGRENNFMAHSGFTVNPKKWSNKTQTIKQRIPSKSDDKFIKDLSDLKEHINNEIRSNHSEYTKQWLEEVIYKFHNKKAADAKTLNEYIAQFIADSESGERKNKGAMNLAPGTINAWRGFQRIFNEYQGIYTVKRKQWHTDNKKPLRPLRKVDFENINIDFYNLWVKFLSDEGYKRGTIGRHIKELKMFMLKALEDGLHNNRQFEYSAFKGISSESFSVYLTQAELEKIANKDLSGRPELDKARDAFLVLCETALRISDYQKVDVSIRGGLIYITQGKTGGSIVIPCSARLKKILKKYGGKLPRMPEQYINRRIKIIAQMCGIDEVQRWTEEKYGKRYEKTAHKWELITCHTGRRTACSLMYLAGIPIISIMQISGHKSEKIFLHYIKVTPEENARKLSLHPYFSGLKVV